MQYASAVLNPRLPPTPIHVSSRQLEQPIARQLSIFYKDSIADYQKNFDSNQKYLLEQIKYAPRQVQKRLIAEYAARYNSTTAKNPVLSANLYIRKATANINKAVEKSGFDDPNCIWQEQHLERLAKNEAIKALELATLMGDGQKSYEHKVFALFGLLTQHAFKKYSFVVDIQAPRADKDNALARTEQIVAKMLTAKWWERRLTRHARRVREHINIISGVVKAGISPYASKDAVKAYRSQQAQNQAYLDMMQVVDEMTGEAVDLATIFKKSSANPEHRYIEYMVRVRGLDEMAVQDGFKAYFITITCPSRFHRWSKGKDNQKWLQECYTPRHASAYLMQLWAQARAKLDRLEIKRYGMWGKEPHHSGTPHLHIALYVHASQAEQALQILKEYAEATDPEEITTKNSNVRFDCKPIELGRGSGVAYYLAKYLMKNATGPNDKSKNDLDEQTEDGSTLGDNFDNIKSWASRWGVRQFQFFGTAPITIYRMLRRVKGVIPCKALERCRKAAQSSKWRRLTRLLNAHNKDDKNIALIYDKRQCRENEFGDVHPIPVGIRFFNRSFIIKTKKYRLERKKDAQAIDAEGGDRSADRLIPWSRLNNCTPPVVDSAVLNGLPTETAYQVRHRVPRKRWKELLKGKTVFDFELGAAWAIKNNQFIEVCA